MASLHRMDSAKRRPGACVCGEPHAGLGQGQEGEVMHRYEDDGMDLLGCVAAIAIAAVIFLVIFIGVKHGI